MTEPLGTIVGRVLRDAPFAMRQLAADSGLSYDVLRSWRSGRRRPSRGSARRLADGLERRGQQLLRLASELREEAADPAETELSRPEGTARAEATPREGMARPEGLVRPEGSNRPEGTARPDARPDPTMRPEGGATRQEPGRPHPGSDGAHSGSGTAAAS